MLEPKVRDFCIRTLDPLAGADRFDLVAAVGAEPPMRVIGMPLGILEADQPAIRDMVDDSLHTEDGGRRELVDDPSLIPGAIEEMLRFEPTGHSIARYVTADVEFHGRTVPAAGVIVFIVASAKS